MGDRTWQEVWVYGEDLLRLAAAYAVNSGGFIYYDDEGTKHSLTLDQWLEDNSALTTEEILEIIGPETVDEHEHGWHLFTPDLDGGGYIYFQRAAEFGARFYGRTGAGCEYTGVQVWSDGGVKLHEWPADSKGEGLKIDFSLYDNVNADLRITKEIALDGKPLVVWGSGVFEELRSFLLGLRKMHMMVGAQCVPGISTSS